MGVKYDVFVMLIMNIKSEIVTELLLKVDY